MAFSVGDRLGRFEILGSLGAGGMGEVYRARDHQLQPRRRDQSPARRRFRTMRIVGADSSRKREPPAG